MTRDNFYLVLGIAVFLVSFLVLYLFTELSIIWDLIIAFLISIASDIVIVVDNERRNTAPDAKFHHKNELVGETATVAEDFIMDNGTYTGRVEIHNEKWKARSHKGILKRDDPVRIIDRKGMIFIVEKFNGRD